MKANTTFTELSQPPDLGNDFIRVGNIAKRANGSANADENPNIPTAGPIAMPDEAASTNRVPIIGPVQENETNANVKAINKMLTKPVVASAFASIFVVHDAGSVKSNAPKNEAANTTNKTKKNILNQAFVERSLSALAPNIVVTRRPNIKYIITIARPYSIALIIAFLLPPLCFKKKLTVMGIIGQTQGVRSANSPPMKLVIKI